MNESAAPIPRQPSRREDAVEIIRRLSAAGHIAYLAGGCVRDELLGLQPKDFDVATDATPDRVQQLFPKSQAIGAAFGVILVRFGKSMIEVATFRADNSYSDGRRPDSVTFTTAETDARRRDFTINGLFFDPIQQRVIDFVGGQDDLRARRLRAIGEAQHRFGEDYLRLLRAVRFSARFDLSIEPATRAAIARFAPRLAQISPERTCDELRLMLTPPTRLRAWEMLRELGLLDVVTRFTRPADASAAAHLFPLVEPGSAISFPLALAAIGADVLRSATANPAHEVFSRDAVGQCVRGLRKALRISNDETEALSMTLRIGDLLDPAAEPPVARMKRFLAMPPSEDGRRLLAAIASVDSTARPRIEWLLARFAELSRTDVAPPPLVTGDDLITAGLAPGPKFKRVLELTYDEQLEGRLIDKPGAMQFALAVARE